MTIIPLILAAALALQAPPASAPSTSTAVSEEEKFCVADELGDYDLEYIAALVVDTDPEAVSRIPLFAGKASEKCASKYKWSETGKDLGMMQAAGWAATTQMEERLKGRYTAKQLEDFFAALDIKDRETFTIFGFRELPKDQQAAFSKRVFDSMGKSGVKEADQDEVAAYFFALARLLEAELLWQEAGKTGKR